MGCHLAGKVHHGQRIDVNGIVPLLEVPFVHSPAGSGARVVHQDIHSTHAFYYALHEVGETVEIAEVAGENLMVTAESLTYRFEFVLGASY
jgi:hypothetical protein